MSTSTMLKVSKLLPQGQGLAPALLKRASTVELDWDVRQKSRFDATDSAGRKIGVFLPRGTAVRGGDVPVAERFEIYLGPIELANGYRELNDADEQRERFGRDLGKRQKRDASLPPIDERLLACLPLLPDCAGVALGVDRLLVAMLGSKNLSDVLALPFDRA